MLNEDISIATDTTKRPRPTQCPNQRPIILSGLTLNRKLKPATKEPLATKSSNYSPLHQQHHQQQQQQQQDRSQQIDACHRLMGRLGLSLPLLRLTSSSSNAQLSWCRQLLEACDKLRRDRDQLSARLHQRDRQLAEVRQELLAMQRQQSAAAGNPRVQPAARCSPPQKEAPQPKPLFHWESRQSLSAQQSQIPRLIRSPMELSRSSAPSPLASSSVADVSTCKSIFTKSPSVKEQRRLSPKQMKSPQTYSCSYSRPPLAATASRSSSATIRKAAQCQPLKRTARTEEDRQQPAFERCRQQRQNHQQRRGRRHRSRGTVDLDAESVRRHWRSRTYDKLACEIESKSPVPPT